MSPEHIAEAAVGSVAYDGMSNLISLEDAQKLVIDSIVPTKPERVPVDRSAGRVLAEDAVAITDLPSFTSSAMDGFAIQLKDVKPGSRLAITGESSAGSPWDGLVDSGFAVQISTGGVVPAGADSVVPVEDTDLDGSEIIIKKVPVLGDHIRASGTDARAGSSILRAGCLIGASQVGALAAAGLTEVQCTKRPRVGIVVTGSELCSPGDTLSEGQIYESNGLMLAAQLSHAGAVPAQLGIVSDDADEQKRTLERALLGFDMVVTSGGASVGPHDLVRETQRKLRVEELFHGVAIRPGKPVTFGMRKKHQIFNLPGNPVSAMVCFELLVRPAVYALLGSQHVLPRFERGILNGAVRQLSSRDQFIRARRCEPMESRVLEPLTAQGSHMIVSAAQADVLVRIERGDGFVQDGSEVSYLPLA